MRSRLDQRIIVRAASAQDDAPAVKHDSDVAGGLQHFAQIRLCQSVMRLRRDGLGSLEIASPWRCSRLRKAQHARHRGVSRGRQLCGLKRLARYGFDLVATETGGRWRVLDYRWMQAFQRSRGAAKRGAKVLVLRHAESCDPSDYVNPSRSSPFKRRCRKSKVNAATQHEATCLHR